LALHYCLKKLNKNIEVVSSGRKLKQQYKFLPYHQAITFDKKELDCLRKFIITLDISKVQAEEFSYKIEGEELKIFITPNRGTFQEADVRTESEAFKYDLIITCDACDLDALGQVYKNSRDLFYSVPIINLDHKMENDRFGQVNIINPKATAVTEVVYSIIKELFPNYLHPELNTLLLTGMISKTKSFQHEYITPAALLIASKLMAHGADKDLIVKQLFHQKTIGMLHVWGKILSRVKNYVDGEVLASYITKEDLNGQQVSASEIVQVVDDLLGHMPHAQVVYLLIPCNGKVREVMWLSKKSRYIVPEEFKATNNQQDLYYKDSSVQISTETLHAAVEKFLGK
jgi:hypothetical protein